MIPKIIHYCWFGGNPLPPIAIECMDSWKKYCGDFEIKEWNESNFDINIVKYAKEAAETKKWAFVADVACFYAIYNYGGVYLDIDIEVVKPIDKFLGSKMFAGFESYDKINGTGIIGAEKNFYLTKKMLDIYNEIPFINADGTLNNTPITVYTSKIMEEEGFALNNTKQNLHDIEVYPSEYFSPKEFRSGEIEITENTYTIHHFMASWWSDEERKKHEENIRFHKTARRFQKAKQSNR